MNMDELLKNIWSAEKTQNMGIIGVSTTGQDRVDGSGVGGSNTPQRQQTLGDMTLEEFLARVGVAMEDTQLAAGKPLNENDMFFGELSCSNNTGGLGIDFQQTGWGMGGLMNNQILENHN
ncbi:hypothetical protein FNV43_RR07114 [Rhamnella rubrinervis]|uniref:Uncharacterized protein n=1 Tax=Rhamnella rubrinervis TaxID=2594499 RepID=A0A8K0MMM8_9ROSA|nr:hypothetical protein FNV43_RR07114 [Rhamnella rubrinervis]